MVHSLTAGSAAPRLSRFLDKALQGLAVLAFPSSCLLCHSSLSRPLDGSVCRGCWESLPRIEEPYCPRCGLPYPTGVASGLCGPCRGSRRRFRLARAAGPYHGPLQETLHHFKYRGRFRLADALGRLTFERCLAAGPLEAGAAVVPVPLHWRRKRQRGYNQAELLAKAIAAASGVPWRRALVKVADRPPQAELGAGGRLRNAAGAYRARLPAELIGKSLLLVDDVLTTGATVEACARTLRRAGAGSIDVITVARVAQA